MSFGLVTALNIEDVPMIMRITARNYRRNAENDEDTILEYTKLHGHHPDLWKFAAELLEQSAQMLDASIKDAREREQENASKTRRAVL
jgi:hypothetical protein